jgi:hypothetical protein
LNPIDTDLAGSNPGGNPWTGTNANGTIASGFALGDFIATIGMTGVIFSDWINFDQVTQTQSLNMYGISQVLTAIPEPSAIVLMGTALGVCGLYGYTCRCRNRPSVPGGETPVASD